LPEKSSQNRENYNFVVQSKFSEKFLNENSKSFIQNEYTYGHVTHQNEPSKVEMFVDVMQILNGVDSKSIFDVDPMFDNIPDFQTIISDKLIED
jgi:hypothetical protein